MGFDVILRRSSQGQPGATKRPRMLLIFRGVLGILRAVQCVLDIPWLIFYDMLTIFYVIFDST